MSEELEQQQTDQAATPEAEQQQQQEEKLLPQSDVNNLIAKEAKKAQEKLLKQLGIEDFDNAKEGMTKFKEWQESQKTEAEKQSERMKELETNFTTTSDENATLKAQISAMQSGVNADYVQDVVTLAKTLVTDEVDMNTAISQVVEKYPHFKGEQQEQQELPKFTTGQHRAGDDKPTDPFASKLAKYK